MSGQADLAGQAVLVTGGCSGLGLAMAETFLRAGARVAVFDRTIPDGFAKAHPEFLLITGDVTDPESVREGFGKAQISLGRLDAVIANAGVSQNKPTLDLDFAEWRRVMSINLDGAFLTCHEAGRLMAASGGGSIILTASMYGVVAAPERLGYCVSKSGTVMMTKALAIEWAQLGIRVNAIAPGYVRTPFVEELVEQGRLDLAKLEKRTPMGRLITPEEVADAACFLISDSARAITGQIIGIDGGWTAYGYL
ncbi:MAG: SDR family oxidoreductase [Rhizobiales bacterium]|jgi:NAD(P)-dependent dehydrogenase (short-subunit alcohol dehydrogenase family)|nr:SDR family oxidoreductase [Hyphomicrobiales bacterium]